MEKITDKALEVLNQDSNTNQTRKNSITEKKNLEKWGSSINALDILGKPLTLDDIVMAEEMLKLNYGVNYPSEKFSMLWQLIKEENWTGERLRRTVKWFLKKKRFPNWTVADWFDYEVRLYPYAWYIQKIHEGAKDSDFVGYRIDGKAYWKFRDGETLPFEEIK